MKVILTGCTGFVGGEVLRQCIQNPSISSIVVLSRRQLSGPIAQNPKVAVKIMQDFLVYPESLMQDLHGAEACKPSMLDLDMYRKINVEYTMAAVGAFSEYRTATGANAKPFRFIYCSGVAAVRDQETTLWLLPGMRRIRGQIENELVAYQENHPDTMHTYIVRPAMILSPNTTLHSLVFGMVASIKVNVLAKVMVDLALNGSEEQIWENSAMIATAQR
ncbi:hypothetical protein AOCH_002255 [Aspergillus ochraceoroseus]|uniref:Thioester reductase (TE) domain-containing protein n=1 Tax=Aspergillus ochraceoroseus TaxID=138278 RepID=A0A0F8VB94_9EURO|nr:hypothetical protein AOCH_002255 [Aspergillus ochraceoroseus]